MDYARWWEDLTIDEFGETVEAAWRTHYLASVAADPTDLVVVDPGNGFRYVFDLAGTLRDGPRRWAPRVVGVWGRSQPGGALRDASRMRGFPRPGRRGDDRGHLIACAAGGGHDINLVPMDAGLNRGRTPEGARFRSMERQVAAQPGALFFIRALYDDDTDRPARFEVGAQSSDELQLDCFENPEGQTSPMSLGMLRTAAPLPISTDIVDGCLDESDPRHALFARALRKGTSTLGVPDRCRIAGITGHVAESVAELVLDDLGWKVLWHFVGPGRHGVDLVFLTSDDKVVAVEVKGTLVSGRVPRLSRRELAQMSAAWIDKVDNPGMAELGLQSTEIYGAVVVVNFPDLTWRIALTADFARLRPVAAIDQLAELSWLDAD